MLISRYIDNIKKIKTKHELLIEGVSVFLMWGSLFSGIPNFMRVPLLSIGIVILALSKWQ